MSKVRVRRPRSLEKARKDHFTSYGPMQTFGRCPVTRCRATRPRESISYRPLKGYSSYSVCIILPQARDLFEYTSVRRYRWRPKQRKRWSRNRSESKPPGTVKGVTGLYTAQGSHSRRDSVDVREKNKTVTRKNSPVCVGRRSRKLQYSQTITGLQRRYYSMYFQVLFFPQ